MSAALEIFLILFLVGAICVYVASYREDRDSEDDRYQTLQDWMEERRRAGNR